MDGLFHGKSHLEVDDDWGCPYDFNGNVPQIRFCFRCTPGEVSNLLATIQKAELKLGKHSQAGACNDGFTCNSNGNAPSKSAKNTSSHNFQWAVLNSL